MAIPSFYHPALSESDTSIELSQAEAGHAMKSRRLRSGAAVRVLNGQGLIGHGSLSISGREATVELTRCERFAKRPQEITLATAIPKGDRHKIMLDMVTQLGVAKIVPLACERSVTSFSNNMREKWSRIMIEACKQSQNPWLPEIADEVPPMEFVRQFSGRLLYADGVGKSLAELNSEPQLTTAVMVGPEGGFSDQEIDYFVSNQLLPVRLGANILRTETAVVAACSQLVQSIEPQV